MKLSKLFEEIMNEPHFDYEVDEDRVKISAIVGGRKVGFIVLETIFDAYREFEDIIEDPEEDFSEEDHYKIFPNDRFIKVEHLEVIDGEKGRGYGKLLMDKAISYSREKGETVMYLNASPMGFSGLRLNDLINFYKSFGFQELIDGGHNMEMFMNI